MIQDFHLAKRHYDLALETNSEAYLPVTLSLTKLYARSLWHTLTGGKDGLSLWGPDEEDTGTHSLFSDLVLSNGLVAHPAKKQLDDGQHHEGSEDKEDVNDQEDEGGPWYFGKAKEEFHKRRGGQTHGGRRGEEEDPIQVCLIQ